MYALWPSASKGRLIGHARDGDHLTGGRGTIHSLLHGERPQIDTALGLERGAGSKTPNKMLNSLETAVAGKAAIFMVIGVRLGCLAQQMHREVAGFREPDRPTLAFHE